MKNSLKLILILSPFFGFSQWSGSTTNTGLIHRDGSIILGGSTVMGNYGSNWKYIELHDEGILSIGPSTSNRMQVVHSSFGSTVASTERLTLSGTEGLRFQTDGDWQNNKMIILQNGNVGIGTNSPSTLLHLRKDNNTVLSPSLITSNDISGMRLSNLSTTANAGTVLNFQLGGTGTSMAAIAATRPSANNSSIHFYTENANSLGERMTITPSGNVGIGTTSPSIWFQNHVFEINNSRPVLSLKSTGTLGTMVFTNSSIASNHHGEFHLNHSYSNIDPIKSTLTFYSYPGGATLSLQSSGNVGIGTTNPQSKLAVNGQIRATEVKVLNDISVPDYVFEPDYELRTLKETKAYIQEHKHLPEIPSAREIGENGIDLGDMNMRLLRKIEELTLYQIELLEKLEEQNDKLLEQQKRIEKLESEG